MTRAPLLTRSRPRSYGRRMPLLSTAEVATRLGVSKRTVHRLVVAGKLDAQQVGPALAYEEADVDAYIEARTVEPVAS